ncbi:MAG: IS3 family transposase [Verrucomicrobiota bacterium]|jgi:putative transposase
MIEPNCKQLSQRRQCQLLSIARSTAQYKPKAPSAEKLKLCRRIDEIHMIDPTFGARRMMATLKRDGIPIGRKQVSGLMKQMGIQAIYRKPRLSIPNRESKRYPYLLKDIEIERPDQVWCADITYIPMKHGHLYLVAVMDWYSRKVLSWKLSNTMDERFCVEALDEALSKAKKMPEIVNTDQGSQFTGEAWVSTVEDHGVKVSQDGRGRWMDNVMIERLWRSVKYECVFPWGPSDGRQLQERLEDWFERYNHWRPHQSLGYKTPAQIARERANRKVA